MSKVDNRFSLLIVAVRASLLGALTAFLCVRGLGLVIEMAVPMLYGITPAGAAHFEIYGGFANYFQHTLIPRALYHLTSDTLSIALLGAIIGLGVHITLSKTPPRSATRYLYLSLVGVAVIGYDIAPRFPGDIFWTSVKILLWILTVFVLTKLFDTAGGNS